MTNKIEQTIPANIKTRKSTQPSPEATRKVRAELAKKTASDKIVRAVREVQAGYAIDPMQYRRRVDVLDNHGVEEFFWLHSVITQSGEQWDIAVPVDFILPNVAADADMSTMRGLSKRLKKQQTASMFTYLTKEHEDAGEEPESKGVHDKCIHLLKKNWVYLSEVLFPDKSLPKAARTSWVEVEINNYVINYQKGGKSEDGPILPRHCGYIDLLGKVGNVLIPIEFGGNINQKSTQVRKQVLGIQAYCLEQGYNQDAFSVVPFVGQYEFDKERQKGIVKLVQPKPVSPSRQQVVVYNDSRSEKVIFSSYY